MRRVLSRIAAHLAAAAIFLTLAVLWSWPLAQHLPTHISGQAGDNLAFLWNTWWMRMAIASPALHFFHTDYLFAPFGIDLILHTHTALPSWLGATLYGHWSVITAQNLVNLTSLTLNGWCAYLLAWDRLGRRGPALVAGIIFAGCPYVSAHLLGHFNLICAWPLPIFMLCLWRAIDRASPLWSAAAGVCLAIVGYCDYYYLVYCTSIVALLLVVRLFPGRVIVHRLPIQKWLWRFVVASLALDVLLIFMLEWRGGQTVVWMGHAIRVNRPTNLLSAAWILLAVLLAARYRPRVDFRIPDLPSMATAARIVLPGMVLAIVGLFPLIAIASTSLIAGRYVEPTHSWRSGPSGIDLATLVLGNPFNQWFGSFARAAYRTLRLDPVEGVGWLGVVPVVLAIASASRWRTDREVRRWLLVGAVFLVAACGPWLHVAGVDTGLLLPQNLLSFLPIVSNARIPGRALVVVMLAVAILAAAALARLSTAGRSYIVWLAAGLVILDYLPAPFPMTQIEVPAIYQTLAKLEGGAVCELPMGIRDGFGMTGVFDDRRLTYQMVHGHPITGGFAARIGRSTVAGYEIAPVLRSLWALSQGGAIAEPDQALSRADLAQLLHAQSIDFVMLDRSAAPSALAAFVDTTLPLRLIERDGTRELFAVETIDAR